MAFRLPLSLIKPALSLPQQALRWALYGNADEAAGGHTTLFPEWLRRIAATKTTYDPYLEPHSRREFFRKFTQLPHRQRQIERLVTEPEWEYTTSKGLYQNGFDAWLSPEEVLDPETSLFGAPGSIAEAQQIVGGKSPLDDSDIFEALHRQQGSSYTPDAVDPLEQAMTDRLQAFLAEGESAPTPAPAIAGPIDEILRRIGVRK